MWAHDAKYAFRFDFLVNLYDSIIKYIYIVVILFVAQLDCTDYLLLEGTVFTIKECIQNIRYL